MHERAASPDLSSTMLQAHLTMFATKAAFHLGPDRACSLIAADQGHARRVASSDARAAWCDEVETTHDTGPCLDAMRDQQVIIVHDLTTDNPWPDWSEAARAAGFRSAGAFPGHTNTTASVSLNVYTRAPDPWNRDTIVHCDAYAQIVATMVDLTADIRDLDRRRQALQDALTAQTLIDQAVGAIMATNNCDRTEALQILKAASRDGGSDLSTVAREMLDAITRRPPR